MPAFFPITAETFTNSLSAGTVYDVTDTRIGLVGVPLSGGTPSNEDAAFSAMAALANQTPGAVFRFRERRYGLTKWNFLRSVHSFSLIGNGCEIQSVNPSNAFFGDTGCLNINPGLSLNQTSDFHSPGSWDNGYLINTASAYATSVTATTPAEAANFSVGEWVLINSLCFQQTGSPPNMLWKDYNRVRAINAGTGVITLWYPLKFDHRSDQFDFTPAGSYVAGKARIKKLSRGSSFEVCRSAYVENVTFLDNPTNPTAGWKGFGQLYATGCLFARFKGVTAGNFVPSESATVVAEDCNFQTIEVDKLGIDLRIIRGEHGTFTGGSGYHSIVSEKAHYREQVDLEVNNFLSIGDLFTCDDSGTAMVSVVATHCNFVSPRVRRRDTTDDLYLLLPAGAVQTLPVATAVTATTLEFALALDQWFGMYMLRRGCELFLGTSPSGKRGVVKEVRYNAGTGKALIDVFNWSGGAPLVGDAMKYYPSNQFGVAPDLMDEYGNPTRNINQVDFPERSIQYGNRGAYPGTRTIDFAFPNDAAARTYTPNGTIRRIEACCVTAQAGKSANFQLALGTPPAWVINHVYGAASFVNNDTGKIYYTAAGGTSAGAGGPTGTGNAIVDNTVTWAYVGTIGQELAFTFDCSTAHTVVIDQFGISGMTSGDSFANVYGSGGVFGGTNNWLSVGAKSFSMGGNPTTVAGYLSIEYRPLVV